MLALSIMAILKRTTKGKQNNLHQKRVVGSGILIGGPKVAQFTGQSRLVGNPNLTMTTKRLYFLYIRMKHKGEVNE